MMNEIVLKIVLTIVGFIVTGILGYLVAKLKERKRNDRNIEKALKCLLRSSITKIFYTYTELGYIPRFERENVTYLYAQYKEMNGNSYIDQIYPEIMKLPVRSN